MINEKIFDLSVEALCNHNDGWVKRLYIKRLAEATKKAETQELMFIYRILTLTESR